MSDFIIIIPARYASTRYPGKPLVRLKGATGVEKTLIQRSWECASAVEGCSGMWVATDDERIAEEVQRFGGRVVMTSPDCANGTERVADALRSIESDAKLIVNLQGDAPLSPAASVPNLIERLLHDRDAVMATPAVRCSPFELAHLQADDAAGQVGGTTAVFDRAGHALYFSKRILPYLPTGARASEAVVHLHVGLYAYRREALATYVACAPSELEKREGLEQLRFLHLGLKVAIVASEPLGWNAVELNNPSDIPAIERELARRSIS